MPRAQNGVYVRRKLFAVARLPIDFGIDVAVEFFGRQAPAAVSLGDRPEVVRRICGCGL